MCFSPSASFGAAVVLSAVGAVAMSRADTASKKVLCAIPFIFAFQQFTEGMLWLSLLHSQWAAFTTSATYAFLIFAQVVWPAYIPLVILLFEKDKRRKKFISAFLIFGLLFALQALYSIFAYPIAVQAQHNHIQYELGFSLTQKWYYGLLYFVPTVFAPLLSSNKNLHWLGYVFFVSYVAARLLFHFYVISVWCFFGALTSVVVLMIVTRMRVAEAQTAVERQG
jgi:hypothetical protein